MGISQSHNDQTSKPVPHSPGQSVDNTQNESVNELATDSSEIPLFEDLLIEILSYVPLEDLIFNCRLVCKQWKSLVDAQSVWRLKCARENVKLPSRKFQKLPDHFYRFIYCHSITEKKNCLRNPCGEQKFAGWESGRSLNEERGFKVENPPAGADPVPAEVGSQSCFATTYYKCEKYQVINLADNAVNRFLLQNNLVNITVGEWYAARFDCAAEYELKVILYGDIQEIVDHFEFRWSETQWCGKEWHLVTHTFEDVKDVSEVWFYHQGKDQQYWAGHFGSKMTGAFVKLCTK